MAAKKGSIGSVKAAKVTFGKRKQEVMLKATTSTTEKKKIIGVRVDNTLILCLNCRTLVYL